MEVNNTTQPTLGAANNRPSTGASSLISSDFETFLQMLTAQARYQDPLEPMDSSEYAAQLAQFSMVEQQVLSNDILTELSANAGIGDMAQVAGWIGMEARTTAAVKFDGTPLSVLPSPEQGAEEAFLVAYDSSGAVVSRQQISVSTQPVTWNGTGTNGAPLPDGQYSFAVESRTTGQITDTSEAETYARIIEARRQGGETLLILDGGSSISSNDVSALRSPS